MRLPRLIFLPALLVVLINLPGCFPLDGGNVAREPAGFFTGIWHGWIAPISVVFGFFDRSVRVYEIHNTGWWYDLGFYMAIISGFGGLSLMRRKRESELHR